LLKEKHHFSEKRTSEQGKTYLEELELGKRQDRIVLNMLKTRLCDQLAERKVRRNDTVYNKKEGQKMQKNSAWIAKLRRR